MQLVERSQLCKLLSSDNFNHQRGVIMLITITISAIQSHTLDVAADEMSNSRHSSSLISISEGYNHPRCRKPQGSLRSFSLTGTIFLSILSHFPRIQSSRSQYFTSTNHLLCGFISTFYLRLASKVPSSSDLPLIGPRP